MSCVSIAPISEVCGSNPGGLKPKIYLVRKADISAIPSAVALVVSTAITMISTKVFAMWDFAIDTGELKVETAGAENNPAITASIDFNIPRNNAVVDAVIQAALGQQLVAICQDANGNFRILGNLDRGCYLTFKGSSGKKGIDSSGKDCSLKIEGLSEIPYYYTASIPTV